MFHCSFMTMPKKEGGRTGEERMRKGHKNRKKGGGMKDGNRRIREGERALNSVFCVF